MSFGRDMALGAACSDLGCFMLGLAFVALAGAVGFFAAYGVLHLFGVIS